jgi:hypothetical protein
MFAFPAPAVSVWSGKPAAAGSRAQRASRIAADMDWLVARDGRASWSHWLVALVGGIGWWHGMVVRVGRIGWSHWLVALVGRRGGGGGGKKEEGKKGGRGEGRREEGGKCLQEGEAAMAPMRTMWLC